MESSVCCLHPLDMWHSTEAWWAMLNRATPLKKTDCPSSRQLFPIASHSGLDFTLLFPSHVSILSSLSSHRSVTIAVNSHVQLPCSIQKTCLLRVIQYLWPAESFHPGPQWSRCFEGMGIMQMSHWRWIEHSRYLSRWIITSCQSLC